jgi:hypothetical protein
MKNIPIDTGLLLLFKTLIETRSLTLIKLRTIFNDSLFVKSGYGMLATPSITGDLRSGR